MLQSTPDNWSAYVPKMNNSATAMVRCGGYNTNAHFIMYRQLFVVMLQLVKNTDIEIAVVSLIRRTRDLADDFVALVYG